MKKVISLFLSIVILTSLLSISSVTNAKTKETFWGDKTFFYYPDEVFENEKGFQFAYAYEKWDDSIEEYGPYIVGYAGSSSTVTLPTSCDGETVLGVWSFAFSGADFKKVTIKGSYPISPYAFSYCEKLETVDMSDGYVYGINQGAFLGCKKLNKVVMPDCTWISEYAFEDCSSLTSVKLPNSLEGIEHWAFKGTNIFEFNIPKNVSYIASTALDSYSYCNIKVSKYNKKYSSYKGALYNKKKTKLLKYLCQYTGKWPKTMTAVGTDAFHINGLNFTYDSNIKFPSKITKLGDYAFYGVSCKELSLAGKIKTIPSWCFSESNFSLLSIPNSVKKISYGAYERATIKEVDLPNGLKTIDAYAFNKIKLKGKSIITVPASVKTIGKKAFTTKYLAGYKGSAAQKYAKKNKIKFVIAPAKGTLKSVKSPKKGAVKVDWKKVKGAKGYQVQISTSSTMSENTDRGTVKGGKNTSTGTITNLKLKKGKTYYVQVRAYTTKKLGGKKKTVYGTWSAVKKVKIKK